MFSIIFFASLICACVGLIAKLVIDHTKAFDTRGDHRRISWHEYLVGLVVACLLVVPGVTIVGTNMAKADLLEFDEFWNGYETAALVSTNNCSRDGSCRFEYDCDHYTHRWTTTDSDGNVTHHSEERHHDCPYATSETTYKIATTLDDFTIDTTIDDDAREWRAGKGIPSNYARGVPAFWQAAADRIAAGDPGPVTVQRTYDNYILAAQNTILDEFEGDVEHYLEEGFLPRTSMDWGIRNHYHGRKLHDMAGGLPAYNELDFALNRLNAALGTDLQGDMHIVAVPAEVDQHRYAGALNAYWTGDAYGDSALSKNGIVVILGIEDAEIVWSEAFTGMPVGNELMLTRLRQLEGTPLTADDLIGRPVGILADGDVDEISHGTGAIETIVWADDRPFERICMTCKDPGENGGYGYLIGDVEPTTGQKWGIFTAALFFASLVWVAFVMIGNHYVRGDDNDNHRIARAVYRRPSGPRLR